MARARHRSLSDAQHAWRADCAIDDRRVRGSLPLRSFRASLARRRPGCGASEVANPTAAFARRTENADPQIDLTVYGCASLVAGFSLRCRQFLQLHCEQQIIP